MSVSYVLAISSKHLGLPKCNQQESKLTCFFNMDSGIRQNDRLFQSYYQQADSMTRDKSCYQLVDSLTCEPDILHLKDVGYLNTYHKRTN